MDQLGTQTRIVGGGHTLFFFNSKPVALLDSVSDAGQQPAGTPYEAITSVGDLRPRELVTQPVIREGTMTLTLREVWNAPVWWRLGAEASGLDVPKNGIFAPPSGGRSYNIQDIFQYLNARLRRGEPGITCLSMIYEPSGVPGEYVAVRGKQYFNCVLNTVADGDQITVAGLSTTKTIGVVYTHVGDPVNAQAASQSRANYAR